MNKDLEQAILSIQKTCAEIQLTLKSVNELRITMERLHFVQEGTSQYNAESWEDLYVTLGKLLGK